MHYSRDVPRGGWVIAKRPWIALLAAGCGGPWAETAASYSIDRYVIAGESGDRAIECPAHGAAKPVWGTDVYRADSSICAAAVHAGIIDLDHGGTVRFEMWRSKGAFRGTSRHGITSLTGDQSDACSHPDEGSVCGAFTFIKESRGSDSK
jgi:hypothetical protein